MYVEIMTPDVEIYKGDAELVQLPGIDGSFELLNNHAPLISALAKGKIKIRTGGKERFFDIAGGVIEVHDNKVLILAE
ncbi:MAG: ATP synthase F1 subunit epsilon [Bacteroidetes bacterium GWF2_41_31]|jgi:F-type H+-transporting ATPase subunit epsilon|nr:ATP synthase F1 subunit epsilon [Bacteroidota bacterium]OFY48141.1 MAG: ATP synthase F1 subunit epsilon [Bacteroidetes bacterium GWF2_41_31]PKP31789.1 MAG: ATP synthase F1 subunit epsilon [Bacteroidetes bacterium HGW-Bacteroidetes-16]